LAEARYWIEGVTLSAVGMIGLVGEFCIKYRNLVTQTEFAIRDSAKIV